MEGKQFGSFFAVEGHNRPKEDLKEMARAALEELLQFADKENIDLFNTKIELIFGESYTFDHEFRNPTPRTTVAWKATIKDGK